MALSLATALPKRFARGTHRICPPEETYARIAPCFEACGITRVADITGLDFLGIPVCVAVRPLSQNLTVAQGKGETLAAARVSAAMESIEAFHAEEPPLEIVHAAHRELDRVIDPRTLLPAPNSLYHDELPIDWVAGEDLLAGERVMVPYDLVHSRYLTDPLPAPACFLMTSNGLASGNDTSEAICHGIYEVVERDAHSLWQLAGLRHPERRFIDLDSVDGPCSRALVERVREAGLGLSVWSEPTAIGIAAFGAAIVEDDPPLGSKGGGCHLDRDVALARAITEAAQSRLTLISGARDDLFRRRYRTKPGAPLPAKACEDYRAVPTAGTDTLDGDLAELLTRLRGAGFERVVAVDLQRAELGIAVVRVIIPDMEFIGDQGSHRVLGRRARALGLPERAGSRALLRD